jgi:WD40 repeat protein
MPDTENVEILFVPKNVEDSIWSTAFSRDQDKILTGSTNGIFTYWDLSTKNVIFEVHAHDEKIRAIAISSDGSKAISCGDDNIMCFFQVKNRPV